MQKAPKIAVINANEDIVEAIMLALSTEGFLTAGAHLIDFKRGRKDFFTFIQSEKPEAIVLDIAPPYEENWEYFKLLQASIEDLHIPFIITTTNEHLLKKAIGDDEVDTVEIMGKPFDIQTIVNKVNNAIAVKVPRN